MTGAILYSAKLTNANFTNANLTNANFFSLSNGDGATLTNTNFSGDNRQRREPPAGDGHRFYGQPTLQYGQLLEPRSFGHRIRR